MQKDVYKRQGNTYTGTGSGIAYNGKLILNVNSSGWGSPKAVSYTHLDIQASARNERGTLHRTRETDYPSSDFA